MQEGLLSPMSISPDELKRMDFNALWKLRDDENNQAKALQNYLAPYEHRALTRKVVEDNPLMALPMLVGTPAYTAGKLMPKSWTGLKNRSDASLLEIGQGWTGIGEGLLNYLRR